MIKSVHFIRQKISIVHLYEQYYTSGTGRLICSLTRSLGLPIHQPVDLIFEHIPAGGGLTKIYSPQLYFFEELAEGLYETDQYLDYIRENKELFIWLPRNKHLYQIRKNIGKEFNNN